MERHTRCHHLEQISQQKMPTLIDLDQDAMPLTKSFRGKHSGDLPGSHFFSPVSGGTQCSEGLRGVDVSRWDEDPPTEVDFLF